MFETKLNVLVTDLEMYLLLYKSYANGQGSGKKI